MEVAEVNALTLFPLLEGNLSGVHRAWRCVRCGLFAHGCSYAGLVSCSFYVACFCERVLNLVTSFPCIDRDDHVVVSPLCCSCDQLSC